MSSFQLLYLSTRRLNTSGARIFDKVSTQQFLKQAPLDHYSAPKNPIVLCHGFSGFDKLTLIPGPGELPHNKEKQLQEVVSKGILEFDYWRGIQFALESIGSQVLIARVPAFDDIKSRAINLDHFLNKSCKKIQEELSKPDTPIELNLISHSMGGLDSRYLISKLHGNNSRYKISSLTTISTPHHGSECADFITDLVGDNKVISQLVPKSIFEMTTANMEAFNKTVLDDPQVNYFSYGARFNPRWYNFFNLTWLITKYKIQTKKKSNKTESEFQSLVDNDGLVSVASSKWGQYMGTFDEVDHLDLINWTNDARSTFNKIMFNQDPPFNPILLYLEIANNLAKKGF
ncbi:Lipase 2 [Spathaspora sp. JA1]|nr:Lipase 2 [Spathaspora sp. JA1]